MTTIGSPLLWGAFAALVVVALSAFAAEPVVEPTGPDTMLVFTLGNIEAIARVHPEDREQAGIKYAFEVDMGKAKLFDVKTGKRL